MCIGIPMKVQSVEDGFVWAIEGIAPYTRCKINTLLVDALHEGDWILAFLESAREKISEERANEVIQTIQLVSNSMNGHLNAFDDISFTLPSEQSIEQLEVFIGNKGKGDPNGLN